jgi:hypothetical protein
MSRPLIALAVALAMPLFATGKLAPRPAAAELPVGKWQVEFTNGVVETCEIGANGSAFEAEPLRRSPGKATIQGRCVVIAFDDDRTERWTRLDRRWLVEHWCPSKAFPRGKPVLGVAERRQ